MTVIAAVHQDGETWIGADGVSLEGSTRIYGQKKLVAGPGFVLGGAGNVRTRLLVTRHIAEIGADLDPLAIAVAIRTVLNTDGYAHMSADDGKGPQDYGQVFLLALQTGVWLIAPDFGVCPIQEGQLHAVGCGSDFALGAGFALGDRHPKDRVEMAVGAACMFDTHCGGAIEVQRVPASVPASALRQVV